MLTDPFALIRKRDTGVSTSFSGIMEHEEHRDTGGVFFEDPQKSAVAHQEHREHIQKVEEQASVAIAKPGIVTIPEIQGSSYELVPQEWRAGLQRLSAMRRPQAAAPDRWAQIVMDGHRFAWMWNAQPEITNWSIGSLFGFNPTDPEACSLVLDIRGGWVVQIRIDERGRDVATIVDGPFPAAGPYRWHVRCMPDETAALWSLGARREGQK